MIHVQFSLLDYVPNTTLPQFCNHFQYTVMFLLLYPVHSLGFLFLLIIHPFAHKNFLEKKKKRV